MAKKQEQQRGYMQIAVPSGGKSKYISEQAYLYGLDKRGIADINAMQSCRNINVKTLPYIESASTPLDSGLIISEGEIVGVYAYDDSLFVINAYRDKTSNEDMVRLSRISEDEKGQITNDTGTVSTTWADAVGTKDEKYIQREMSVFCYYPQSIAQTAYEVKPIYYLLIYPDRKYIEVDFESDDNVKVIAPEMEYVDSTSFTHNLTFNDADELSVKTTINKDGTVDVAAIKYADKAFKGCKLKATFTDASNNACVGEVAFKGTYSTNPGYGVFLKSVEIKTETDGTVVSTKTVLRLRGARPTSGTKETFYVKNTANGDEVFSKEIDFSKVYGEISEDFEIEGLSKGVKYYAYFDYNDNYTRYDLTFTIEDETEQSGADVNGKFFDANGSAVVLDIAKEYTVSYNITDGVSKSYMAKENGDFVIVLKSQEDADGESLSPEFEHITVWNSRLFGTKGSVVVCSSAGTPFDWTADSPESELFGIPVGGYDESHSWYSTTQANTQASGDVVAITSYDGHPVIFKDDYMHEVYNTSNPFRIQDICSIGCVSARSVCELDSVLYFASQTGIYRYSGGYPKRVSDALGDFVCDSYTVCGAYDGVLYVYNPNYSEELIYSYSPSSGLWAAVDNIFENKNAPVGIIGLVSNKNYLYAISEDGQIGYFCKAGSIKSGEWSFTTSLQLFNSSFDKRLNSVMIVSEGAAPKVSINDVDVATSSSVGGGIKKTRVLLRGFDGESAKMTVSANDYTQIHRIDILYSKSGPRYK